MDNSAKTRIIFMGTPTFAVPSLNELIARSAEQGWTVAGIYTQPDRRAGRGHKVIASPVKQAGSEHNIPIFQPQNLRRDQEAIAQLVALAPDLIVVAAYGMILPADVLEIPLYGSLNVHASLLPAYRGASPINAALLDGVAETGNSIMLMEEGLDTGPVLAQEIEPILPTDTAVSLTARLAESGAQLLAETLPEWLAGEITPIAQDELAGDVSVCRIIKKQDGLIDWTQSARRIERMTRAFHPWPGAFTLWQNQPFRIISASVAEGEAIPGMVIQTDAAIAVGTGQGILLLDEVQPSGKRSMHIKSFVNGAPSFVGSSLAANSPA